MEAKTNGCGGVCAAAGFYGRGAACGLKAAGELDLCIIMAQERCAAAATFTTNAFRAAPILVTEEHLAGDGYLQAVVVNAGNANAWTGEQGEKDARSMADLTARETGIDPRDVAVASTGVIGRYLDMDKVSGGIAEAAAQLREDGSAEAARAIMTTDTHPKEMALDCGGYVVGGMAKGSGMIKPDMATMLAFITTDAEVEPERPGRGAALRGRSHLQPYQHRRLHQHQRHGAGHGQRDVGKAPGRRGDRGAALPGLFGAGPRHRRGRRGRHALRDRARARGGDERGGEDGRPWRWPSPPC